MASFDEHIQQAKSNLKFLAATNSKNKQFWDWQVTTTFYVAVHIVNAHLAKVADLHYRAHEDVKNALNPYSLVSVGKVPEEIYLAYTKLEGLSRRSRYLCSQELSDTSTVAHFTYDKHFSRAIRYIDKLISYFKKRYSFECDKEKIDCPELNKKEKIENFQI